MQSDSSRQRGIEMNSLQAKLDGHTFPIAKDDFLEAFRDHELVLPDGKTTTLEDVLGPAGVDEFHSIKDLIETVSQMVGRDAVGRAGQTGRGTSDLTPRATDRPPGQPDDDTPGDQSL